MKFNTYAEAIAHVIDRPGCAPFTVTQIPDAAPGLRETHDLCIGANHADDWLHEAYNQSGETIYYDTRLHVEAGEQTIGYVLVWCDGEGFTERCYAVRL